MTSTHLCKFVLSIPLVILTAACASSGNTVVTDSRTRVSNANDAAVVDVNLHDTQTTVDRDVAVTATQAIGALPAAYAKLGVKDAAVTSVTNEVRTIGVRNLRLHGLLGGVRLSSYIDCGSGSMANPAISYDVNFSATTYVTPRDGGATLHTLVTASAKDPAANAPSVHCVSTGGFERRLAQLVSAP
jgi:hypothetical protein